MTSTSRVGALKRKLAEVRLQLEMSIAAVVALNPDWSYRRIGTEVGYPASWICEIAKKYGKNRGSKISTTESN
jgi:hypothetical protein